MGRRSANTVVGAVIGAAVLVAAHHWTAVGAQAPLALPVDSSGGPLRGILVVHPDDCAGNLRFLDLLGHADVRRRVEVVRVASPTPSGVERLRERLPPHLQGLATVALGAADRRAIGRLGYRYGPLLLLYDDQARLRAIEPAPSSPVEMIRMGRRLRGRAAGSPPESPKVSVLP